MTTTSVLHDTFVIEREYPVAPSRVFGAFADLDAKKQWFAGPHDWESVGDHTLDFRVGGHEHEAGGPPDGPIHHYDATYLDIVDDARIIYSYSMALDGTPISISLATIELTPTTGGTRLRLTEHGAYFDSADGPALRREGTEELLDALGAVLDGPR